MLRGTAILIGIAFTLLLLPLALHQTTPNILGVSTLQISTLASLINLSRQQSGVTPLHLSTQLNSAAQAKAADMLQKGYWSHNSIDQKTPWKFIDATGYQYEVAGENIARDFETETQVVDAWLASTTHRQNLLYDQFQDMGLAIVSGENPNGRQSTVIVQMLAKTASEKKDLNRYIPTQTVSHHAIPISLLPILALICLKIGILIIQKLRIHQRNKRSPDISLWHH